MWILSYGFIIGTIEILNTKNSNDYMEFCPNWIENNSTTNKNRDCPREHNSVDRDIVSNMQVPEFKF
jgi:hypothetical protein